MRVSQAPPLLLACLACAAQDNSYIDSKLCNTCHASIYASYRDTGMARAFSRPVPSDTRTLPFRHALTNSFYTMEQRAGKYVQSRWQTGGDGRKINRAEWTADYVMGSGNHVRTFLHRNPDGTLIELPLARYAENGGLWAMNPGYDTGHFITPRKIAYECMFCHNAYPRTPPNHERVNSVPVYLDPLPEGIDCQRCHGPGAAHIRSPKTPGNIVNPARLAGDRQMEICMQCHLQTTSFRLPASIRRFDRGPFSYRAGEPLAGFLLFFDRAPSQQPAKFEIVNSVYRLRQSRCFLESRGKLTCLTCHDPHRIPRGREAITHYNAVCRQCHAAAHNRDSDCTSCHMPKRRTDDVVQAIMTDHLIERTKPPGDLLAPIPEFHEDETTAYHGSVIPYYPRDPDPLYTAVAQVEHASNLDTGVHQLAAEIDREKPRLAAFYFQLAEAWRFTGDAARAITAYQQAVQRDPGDAWTLRRLADELLATNSKSQAEEALRRAVQLAPDDARGWYALGAIRGDITDFQKAIQLDPNLPEAHNALGGVFAQGGKMVAAETAFRDALRVQPDLADAQANLGVLLATKGDLPEALDHLERALQTAPHNTTARMNYAIALAKLNRLDEAQRQFEQALQTDPHLAEAHLDLGLLLAGKGDLDQADEHLRQAAASSNPALRQRALQVLQQIGK